MKRFLLLIFLLLPVGCTVPPSPPIAGLLPHSTDTEAKNLFLVTVDGLRWQEVFRGLDLSLATNREYNQRSEAIRALYWTSNAEERAESLMPFLHHTVFRNGTVVGNRDKNSCARVANDWYFSYPGYNEILTGVVDDTLDSNARIPNPNVTFLEQLNAREGYSGKVAAFTSWDVFPYILNVERSGLPLNAFQQADPAETEMERFLNRLQEDIPSPWEHIRLDAFTQHYALSYIKNHHPRIVYIGYGETDDFAHDAQYDQYVMAANRTDRFIQELWQLIQDDPFYRESTILFITVDHGRGEEPEETWRHHASKRSISGSMRALARYEEGIVGSEAVWMAAIGPGIPAQGLVRTDDECLTSDRIAATLLELLGEDYRLFNPEMGLPMQEFSN